MFTRKPDRDADGGDLHRISDGLDHESSFADRLGAHQKNLDAGKFVPSIIGEDLTITGNVSSKGEIQVDGQIQGDVQCGSLLLGEKSQISGGVIAEDVVVRGRVIGSIRGLRVTLQNQCHVEGDIYHQSLAIEHGAYFEGKSRRSDNPLAVSKPAAKTNSAEKTNSTEKANSEHKAEAAIRAAE